MSTASDALKTISGILTVGAVAAPEPFGVVMRVLGAASGAASILFDDGLTEAEVIAAIHRVRKLVTRAEDKATDTTVIHKPRRPSEEVTVETPIEPPGKTTR